MANGNLENEIAKAAAVIKRGGLVAFPTETVYGLGADAFNPEAVGKIYALKGRPADNPLILHVENAAAVESISNEISADAKKLMEGFWPGPLTLVFKKKPGLPGWAGGHPSRTTGTAALRAPSNETARALIKASGRVIAAPSANKAGTPSPTRAEHVRSDFAENVRPDVRPDIRLDYILDGGETVHGLESTVVDVTGAAPLLLRPGAVTVEMLEKALGRAVEVPVIKSNEPPPSPGMKYRHYAPSAPMTLVCGEPEAVSAYIAGQAHVSISNPVRTIGILATEQTVNVYRREFENSPNIFMLNVGSRTEYDVIARNLYACLRKFDKIGVDEIYAEGVEESALGQAIMNRMRKASEGRVVCVN